MQLNPKQQEVVDHGEGPLLVLAGAGSGKTRAIVQRIVRLIREDGVHPDEILAVTFTNKAAAEMASRVAEQLESETRPRWISTFHSTCARFLRRDAQHLNLPRSFTIFDQDDQRKMLAQVAKDLGNVPLDRGALAGYQHFVEHARNMGWLPERAHENGFGATHELRATVYAAYHRRMRANGTLDFGDLLLAVVELLETNERVRQRYQRHWLHLLVDEFQDTNPVQYRLLQLLASPPYNVTVVGDDDQAIYAWRGATVANLLGFEHDFEACRVVRLEQNYRSTQGILDVANELIDHNTQRKAKRLWTELGAGEKPVLMTARDERAEAAWVARTIEELERADVARRGDVAVFYRTNAQSRIYEEQLRRFGINYRVLAGTSFYEREEVKDILAYLRVAVNRTDEIAFARVVNTPRRGLGNKTLDAARALAARAHIELPDALERLRADSDVRLSTRAAASIERLGALLAELGSAAVSQAPSAITTWLLEEIAYLDYLASRHPDTADDRRENLGELLNAMRAYEDEVADTRGAGPPTLAGFLERTALVQPTDVDLTDQAVNLMTIHTAKGLEYDVVFVTGLEDGLIPLVRRGDDDAADLEEERRLAYVAFTRARRRLYLSNALSRRLYGNPSQNRPSRFLDEIPEAMLVDDPESFARPRSRAELALAVGARPERQRAVMPAYEDFDQRSPWESSQVTSYEIPPDGLRMTRPSRDDSELGHYVGRIARHKSFGDGRILQAEYQGPRIKLTVDFGAVGQKKVIRSFVEVL